MAKAFANLRPGVEQVAIGFCDRDGLNHINDTLGHAVGDDALRCFAASVGVAAFTTSTTREAALSAADAAMYLDKASRRLMVHDGTRRRRRDGE